MRFYEDIKYYYFSTNPSTDDEERSIIVRNGLEYFKEEMTAGFKPERSLYANIIKYLCITAFFGAVALMIYFSSTGNVAGVVYTFAGLFIFFGIIAAVPSKTPQRELPRRAKMHPLVGSALCISIGLGVLIPAILAPAYGYTKAFVAGGASWFVICGLFFIFYTVMEIIRLSRTSGHTVTGKCIGYIKMIESSDGMNSHYHNVSTIGTAVFEYYYNGETYKAFQDDNLRFGVLHPSVGETVELTIDTKDPYNIYHRKNTGARIFAFVISFIALAAGITLFCFVPKMNDDNGFVVDTRGGQVRLAKAKFDDDLIRSHINTDDFTVGYYTVVSSTDFDDGIIVELSNGDHRKIPVSDKEKYYDGAGVYIIKPAGGKSGVNFMADEWEYTGSHEVNYG